MWRHTCNTLNNDFQLLGSRKNPIRSIWPPWTLVICRKCEKVREWQIHSQEGMHGGALECTAFPRGDYIESQYGLDASAIKAISAGEKRPREYDWHKATYNDA